MNTTISRILVPVDFSADSNRALEYAADLAARLGASIELVHVIDDSFLTGPWSAELHMHDATDYLTRLEKEAAARLAALESDLTRRGIRTTFVVLQGHPARVIAERARTGAFDLIAMSTHGRTGLSHLLLGSVAERVLRLAPCAVLTLKGIGVESTRDDRVVATASA